MLVLPWQCNFTGRDGLRASIGEKKKISPFLVRCLEIGVSLGVSANCYTPVEFHNSAHHWVKAGGKIR